MDHSFFVITFSYVVDPEAFYDHFEQSEPLNAGERFSILYDADSPSINNFSKVKETVWSRVLIWSLRIAFAALLIYLQSHFNIPNEHELPSN